MGKQLSALILGSALGFSNEFAVWANRLLLNLGYYKTGQLGWEGRRGFHRG